MTSLRSKMDFWPLMAFSVVNYMGHLGKISPENTPEIFFLHTPKKSILYVEVKTIFEAYKDPT